MNQTINPNDYNLPDDYFFVAESWGRRFYKVYFENTDIFSSYAHPYGARYNDAITQCESDGAFLVIPRSKAENDYIGDLIPKEDIWIGINDIDHEGVFVGVDGSDITYTKWDSSEPNNVNNEDAVLIQKWNKNWADYSVNMKQPFVCSLRIQGMFIK